MLAVTAHPGGAGTPACTPGKLFALKPQGSGSQVRYPGGAANFAGQVRSRKAISCHAGQVPALQIIFSPHYEVLPRSQGLSYSVMAAVTMAAFLISSK